MTSDDALPASSPR